MSDTATTTAAEIADEGTIDPKPVADTPAADATAAKEVADPDPAKPTPADELKETVKRMAYEMREARRQTAAYKEQLDRLTPKPEPGAAPTAVDMDRMITERAEALIQRREGDARTQSWQAAGTAEYSDWNERCNQLADMGGAENPAFIQAVTTIPGGHRIVAELSENPAEMVRLLRMPTIEMAIALAGMGQRLSGSSTPVAAAVPISRAPPPIKPIQATARAEVNLDKMSESEFQAAWNKRTRGK